jgi:hypothetical protein
MSNPIEFARDRATDEIKYASSTVSQNARTIGIGLALVLYGLAFGEDKHHWLDLHRTALIAAAACGVACIALDYLQYYFTIWENQWVLSNLESRKQAIIIEEAHDPVRALQMATDLLASADKLADSTCSAKLRDICFHLKFVVAMVGVGIMAYVMTLVLTAPAIK